MSAVAPVVAGNLQHAPSQPLSHASSSSHNNGSLNTHPSPVMPAFVSSSSDRSLHAGGPHYTGSAAAAATAAHPHHVMIQAQAQVQAQQLFRQRQLMAYQRQQQHMRQLHVPTHAPSGVLSSSMPASQAHPLVTDHDAVQGNDPPPTAEMNNKPSSSTGMMPLQTNDTSPVATTTTTTTTPNLTPSLKSLKRPKLSKRHSKGHAVLRLLQFAEQLDPGNQALQKTFWDGFISDFFTKSSKTKLGLRNSDTDEQRLFYISHYSVAKFFHTLYESGGVSSIQLTLEQTMEFILPGGHMNVECPRANFIYRYTNGSLVSSTGHLWVRFSLTANRIWKIKHFEFACQRNEEFISRSHLVMNKDGSKLKKSNKNTLPVSPINVWGIPPKAFHMLQMMDAAVQLDDIIFYSLIAGTTAKESLAALAFHMDQPQPQATTTDSVLDTPDPPPTPGQMDLLPSPPSGTKSSTKPNKKQQRRRTGKPIKQEKWNQQLEKRAQMDHGGSPTVKSEPVCAQQQQQQRQMLLEQQQAYQHPHHLHYQQQQQQQLIIGHNTPLPSGSYQQ